MLTVFIGVVVLLGGLIFFHELGHYSVAKFFGVRVEVFSLGFGKKIFKKRVGETEYCVSLVPLGGYVKLMGDDPYKAVAPEDAHRAFSTQKLYKRFAIVAAGPVANLLLAYVLFIAVFFVGQPQEGTRIGNVAIGSTAWEAGIRAKDRVAEVNSKAVKTWGELSDSLKDRVGEKVELKIERGGQTLNIPYTVATVRQRNAYGEEQEMGGIKGATQYPPAAVAGISNPESLAYKAGLRTGDQITKIGNQSVTSFAEVGEALQAQWTQAGPLTFSVNRPVEKGTPKEEVFSVPLPARPSPEKVGQFGLSENIGIYPTEVFVKEVSRESPAEKGGMQVGDRIVKVAGASVLGFDGIVERVQSLGAKGESIEFQIEREGKPVVLSLKPVLNETEDPITRKAVKSYMVGFRPNISVMESELVTLQIRNPVELIPHAIKETNLLAYRMVVSLAKLVTGKISAKNLGGPVLIASVAGKSLDAGLIPFLQMMAVISINLFLLNLFPIPILDGGHLLFFSIEALKGKPVSIKTMELANQVGMVFILMLVGFTLFNDISRIVLH